MWAHGRKGAKGTAEGAKPYYKVEKWVMALFKWNLKVGKGEEGQQRLGGEFKGDYRGE